MFQWAKKTGWIKKGLSFHTRQVLEFLLTKVKHFMFMLCVTSITNTIWFRAELHTEHGPAEILKTSAAEASFFST